METTIPNTTEALELSERVTDAKFPGGEERGQSGSRSVESPHPYRESNPWEAEARRDKATKIHVALVKARDAGLAITIQQVKAASDQTRELLGKVAGVNRPSPKTMRVVAELMEQYDCTCDAFAGLPGCGEDRTEFCVVHPKAHLKLLTPKQVWSDGSMDKVAR